MQFVAFIQVTHCTGQATQVLLVLYILFKAYKPGRQDDTQDVFEFYRDPELHEVQLFGVGPVQV